MAGRKPKPINLKSTSPDGAVRFFKTICEATRELGFSERGMGKAYHASRNRIGEYELEWLVPEELPSTMLGALSKRVPKRVLRTEAVKMKVKIEDRNKKANELGKMFDCTYCGQPLEGKDRSSYMLLTRLGTESENLETMLEITLTIVCTKLPKILKSHSMHCGMHEKRGTL